MIYLDYSATTPVNKDVLDSFNKVSLEFIGNANSLHGLGSKCNKLIEDATMQIASILNIKSDEVIYTSGSSESNNLAIKGIWERYNKRGNVIITTKYEHSSINETLKYIENNGGIIKYVNTINGVVDLDNLKDLLNDDVLLVTINAVNSEIGLLQDIDNIGKIIKDNSSAFFHTDLTQAIGKININFNNIDLASLSAHKIYGLKGIGMLYKKKNIDLIPIIHGGKSTTIYRSGTPAHPLIVSLSKAIRLSYQNINNNYEYVKSLNSYLKELLKDNNRVVINSNNNCIPHILNISVKGIKAETLLHDLENYDIYVSTKTACSSEDAISESVYELTSDLELAKSSIRISLSHLTTKEELDIFVESLEKCINRL